jgi:cytochrome c-type biogenesis protein CcmH
MRTASTWLRLLTGLFIATFTLLWMVSQTVPSFAQTPDPSDQAHAIAKLLNCPTCGGRNLADCPTDTCTQWKQEIRSQLAAGKSQDQVIDYFKTRFGPTVLQEPPKEGAILLLWVTPVVILIAILIAGVIVLRHISLPRKAITSPAHVSTQSVDSYVARIEEEVGKP